MSKKDQAVTEENAVEANVVTEAPAEIMITNITCPHCGGAIELVRPVVQRRGMLAGKGLEEMTNDELKREKINSGSVLYKATKRGAGVETISANQARFDACVAEMEKRGMNKAAVVATTAPAADGTPVPTAEEVAAAAAEM